MSQQFRFLFGAMGRFFMLALIMAASTGLLLIFWFLRMIWVKTRRQKLLLR